MTDIAELERHVSALEASQHDTIETLRCVVAKLGRIAAVQDEHGLRLERIESDVGQIKRKFDDLTRTLPAMIADTMREVLKEQR